MCFNVGEVVCEAVDDVESEGVVVIGSIEGESEERALGVVENWGCCEV